MAQLTGGSNRLALVLAGPTSDYGYTSFGSDVTTSGLRLGEPGADRQVRQRRHLHLHLYPRDSGEGHRHVRHRHRRPPRDYAAARHGAAADQRIRRHQ